MEKSYPELYQELMSFELPIIPALKYPLRLRDVLNILQEGELEELIDTIHDAGYEKGYMKGWEERERGPK